MEGEHFQKTREVEIQLGHTCESRRQAIPKNLLRSRRDLNKNQAGSLTGRSNV